MNTKSIKFAMIILLILSAISCGNISDERDAGGTGETGELSIDLAVKNIFATKSTFMPGYEDLAPHTYTITGTGPAGSSFSETITHTTSIKIKGLNFGEWTIKVEAFGGEGHLVSIGEGMGKTVIRSGETSSLTIQVLPHTGVGEMNITVKWTGYVANPVIEATLELYGGNPVPVEFDIDKANSSASINAQQKTRAAGYYTLNVRLYDDLNTRSINTYIGGETATVRVVSSMTTEGVIDIRPNSGYGYGDVTITIEPVANPPIDVDITGINCNVLVGSTMTATAVVPDSDPNKADIVYTWILNGENVKRGKENTYTFGNNLLTGNYNLSVTVYSLKNGVVRGGSAKKVLKIINNNYAYLSNLSLSSGFLNPDFDKDTGYYTVDVGYEELYLTVTPTAADQLDQLHADIMVNGERVLSGESSEMITIGFGYTTISIALSDEECGLLRTYTLDVNRPLYFDEIEVSGSLSGITWRSITSSADGMRLAAVSSSGYIYTSTDGGTVWIKQIIAGARSWNSITSSSDGTKLAAVINGGYIYTSTDSGATWTKQTSAGSRYWNSITLSSDGTKLAAVVNGGYIYTSTDSGATWTQQTSAGSRYWYSITSSSDGTKLAAVVNGGYIYASTDSGATWTQQTSAGSRYWKAITSSSNGTKLAAVVNGGYIYTSTDGGATWFERTYSGRRNWYSITSSSDGTKFAAVVSGGYIYTSSIDGGGEYWAVQSSAGSRFWTCIATSANFTKLAAVGLEEVNVFVSE